MTASIIPAVIESCHFPVLTILASADEIRRAVAAQSPTGQASAQGEEEVGPEVSVYRDRTLAMLRRYLRLSIQLGRLPSLVGREFFRARVTSYRVHTFEDSVIFAHDVERCLELLSMFSQRLIARIVLEDYTQEETAALLGCTRRTVVNRFPQAVDELTEIFLRRKLLQAFPSTTQSTTCQEPLINVLSATNTEETK
jgi:hypothetical protein